MAVVNSANTQQGSHKLTPYTTKSVYELAPIKRTRTKSAKNETLSHDNTTANRSHDPQQLSV